MTKKLARYMSILDIPLLMAVLLLVALIFSPSVFFNPGNLTSVLKLASILGFATIGETLIIIIRGIDISVGSVMGFTSMLIAAMIPKIGLGPAMILALAVCLLIGLIKGLFTENLSIPPIVTTMGFMWLLRGISGVFSNGRLIRIRSEQFTAISAVSFGPIPVFFVVVLVFGAILVFLIRRTATGKHLYAIGGSEAAAYYSGINVRAIRIWVYSVATLLFGMAGLLMASYVGSGMPSLAEGYEFRAITAASLAGVSLKGGIGNLFKAILGSIILVMLYSLITSFGISPYLQGIFEGTILIVAVWLCQK